MRTLSIFITLFMLCTTVGSVYAVWKYTNGLVNNTGDPYAIDTSLSIFDYPPDEVLPDDETHTELGQNHLTLLEKLLNDKKYGMNHDNKELVIGYVVDDGLIYSEQHVSGGNLKHLLIDGTSAHALLFQVEYVSDTEYLVYTYVNGDAYTYGIGDEIEVYKTVISKDSGKWVATLSYKGKAEVMRFSTQNKNIRVIDSETWHYSF